MTDMQKLRDEFDESAAREVAKKELLKARLIPAGLSLMESLFISGAHWQFVKDQAAHALQAEKIKVLESEIEFYKCRSCEAVVDANKELNTKIALLESCLKIAMDALKDDCFCVWANDDYEVLDEKCRQCEALEQITAKMEQAK